MIGLRSVYGKMEKILRSIEAGAFSVIPIKIPLKLRATSLVGNSTMNAEMQTTSTIVSLPGSPKDIDQSIRNLQGECK